jgi:3-(3-hydroxy-phenyl)propionate hydroxylase
MAKIPGVLIAGGGAVGLMTGLKLAQEGVPVTILEAESKLVEEYRASTFHPPTIEMLDKVGVAEELAAKALIADKFQLRDRHSGLIAEFDLAVLSKDTRYPYRLQIEQYALSLILYERLSILPNVQILFNHSVVNLTKNDGMISVDVKTPKGVETMEADYVVGADGARSIIRSKSSISFEGMTYPERYFVTMTTFDFREVMPDLAAVNYVSDPKEWFVLLRSPGLWRVTFPTNPEETIYDTDPDPDILESIAQELYQKVHRTGSPYPITYKSMYRVHQRIASNYRNGNVFLAGDAAHVNNPLGGMGLNGGLQDAFFLGSAIAANWNKTHGENILDHYAVERRKIAINFIQAQTAQNEENMRQRDPVIRADKQREMKKIAADKQLSREYLLRTSMILSIKSMEAIPDEL